MVTVPAPKVASPTFTHLNMARGIAALLVLLGHLRSFVFYSYDELKSHNVIDAIVWGSTGFGHQAVMIFFVLSGFFITRSILLDDRKKGFSWPIYLIKRLGRLWIVLVPCLLLTLLWDNVGISLSGMKFYGGQLFPMYNSGPSLETGGTHLDLSTFLGNLVFLQTIEVPIFGSNGPLWSLANEFWYYLMFPLLFVVVTRRRRLAVTTASFALFVIICLFVGPYMVLSGLIWLAGALAYIIYDRGWFTAYLKTYVALGLTLLFLLFSLATSKTHYLTDFTKDLFIGIAMATLVLVLARFEGAPESYRKTARILADASYTMYLVHFPFMALLVNLILHNEKYDASIVGYLIFFGIGLLALTYCYAVYWLFERHTATFRRFCLAKYKGFVEITARR